MKIRLNQVKNDHTALATCMMSFMFLSHAPEMHLQPFRSPVKEDHAPFQPTLHPGSHLTRVLSKGVFLLRISKCDLGLILLFSYVKIMYVGKIIII